MWKMGKIADYKILIKLNKNCSKYGINGGRITKLTVMNNDATLASYDRRWSVTPEKEIGGLVEEIVKTFS